MLPIIYAFAFSLLLPAVFIFLLWRANFQTKLDWLLDSILAIFLISWLFQSSNWSWLGYYIRYLWPVLLIIALYISWKKTRHLSFSLKETERSKPIVVFYIVLILVFGYYNIGVFSSYTTNDKPIELQFPLQDGTYYVGQGGNHALMNYHQIASSQKYALDILKINSLGIRAKGIYPKTLENYYIFGESLHSPCDGKIIEARNDVDNVVPPETDEENIEGNYVKILCDHHDAFVLMAHMQKGSLTVAEDDQVAVSQPIGIVGNSGNTTEPHLHIHAELNGEGVPITFDGRFLVRNSIVKQ